LNSPGSDYADLSRQHVFEQYLRAPWYVRSVHALQKLMIATKVPVCKAHLMIVVVAVEG
jgi:hypothetical protein